MMRLLLLAAFLAAGAGASAQLEGRQEEASTGRTAKPLARARHAMVAAANPFAVDAALRMLDRGGSAVDAAIAAQLVLNLVEPQSSGIGGGAFLLYYDARARAIRAYDGRETAPQEANPSLFLRADGTPMRFHEARIGGRAVGVPGTLRLLELAHARHGKLSWRELFQPAIALAEHGFAMSPRLHGVLRDADHISGDPGVRRIFFEDGQPKRIGTRITNPEFAATLKVVARHGADAFYAGDVARDIVAAVRGHRNAGVLSLDDLATYRVREVEALCGPYRRYRLCGMPPSSSGGIAVLQILGELERFDMATVRPGSAEAVHLITEAERLAFADRGRYVADDRFVDVPVAGLLDRGYLAQRSGLIRAERSMGEAVPGNPPGSHPEYARSAAQAEAGTSHLVVIDRDGNAVSMTTTIEWGFGSGIMVRGFFLNNELTDFDFVPRAGDRPVANAVAPGKRPRSSMSPFLVFDRDGALQAAIGSAGGSLIIGEVAKALVGMLDWNLDVQSAIDLPNFDSRNGATEIEKGTALGILVPSLRALGHEVAVIDMTSGLHGARRSPSGWDGGADPRREGVARGR